MPKFKVELCGIEVDRSGCTRCGRGTDRLVFTMKNGQQQVLLDEVAEAVWDMIERNLKHSPYV